MMYKSRVLSTLVVSAMLAGCATTGVVPITGRKQSILVSDEQVLSLSNQQYQEYMKTAKPSANQTNTAMVRRVGQRLADAVVSYLRANGMAGDVGNYRWEFNLVADKSINAFCMPGGKIVVYEGLLPVTRDEASLAIVLGHEIAHAVAKHSAERISNQMRQQYGGKILGGVLQGVGVDAGTQQISSAVFGIGSSLGSASYSRKQENEADRLGLIFSAMAGYDPHVAVAFWQRMSQSTGGGSSSMFSDHPADSKRIANIQECMPEAMKYYNSGGKTINISKGSMPQTTRTFHVSSNKH